MEWDLKDPQRVDVDIMLRRASSKVYLDSLVRRGARRMSIVSRRVLDHLIHQAIWESVRKFREEGRISLALTEARLAEESRRELNGLLDKVQQLGALTSEGDVYVAESDERDRIPISFRGDDLALGRGLDLGTVNIVACAKSIAGGSILYNVQRNVLIDVRGDGFTQSILRKYGIECVVHEGRAYVVGDPAFELATIFDRMIRRPLKASSGAASEPDGALIVQHLLERLLGQPQKPNEICVYSIPGDPVEPERNFIYHRGILENALRNLGYAPRPMVESQVIIQAEFKDKEYTGMAVTCGGGTFNVCVAFRGVPAMSFSIARGGDWVDQNVGQMVDMPAAQVCAVKEHGIHLYRPQNHIENALSIYYRQLIRYTVEIMKERMSDAEWITSFRKPIDIAFAGGTAQVGGFIEMFREELLKNPLPFPTGAIRMAENPLQAVAEGCLRAALEETQALEEEPVLMTPSVIDRAPTSQTQPALRSTARPQLPAQ